MKERPILFSGPMVRAIIEGRKTQTRRVVKPQPGDHPSDDGYGVTYRCPYGAPGDRLWVRETFGWYSGILQGSYAYTPPEKPTYPPHKVIDGVRHAICYRADYPKHRWNKNDSGWKPSIHMPRTASRITLPIVSVRVERLQSISEEDAKAEGAAMDYDGPYSFSQAFNYRGGYRTLWESINGPGSWDANPWVWVIEFKRVMQEVTNSYA